MRDVVREIKKKKYFDEKINLIGLAYLLRFGAAVIFKTGNEAL